MFHHKTCFCTLIWKTVLAIASRNSALCICQVLLLDICCTYVYFLFFDILGPTLSTRHTSVKDMQKTDGRTDRVTIAYRALAYNAPCGKLVEHYAHLHEVNSIDIWTVMVMQQCAGTDVTRMET